MKIHDLKIWPELFESLTSFNRWWDLRYNVEREIAKGELIAYREYDVKGKRYTGRVEFRRVDRVFVNSNLPEPLLEDGVALFTLTRPCSAAMPIEAQQETIEAIRAFSDALKARAA